MHEAKVVWQRLAGLVRFGQSRIRTPPIDNQDEVERLLRELTKAMPLSALATPALMANLREQSSSANITLDCKVTKVIYAGGLRRTRDIASSTSDATVRPTLPPPTTSGRSSLQPERPKHPVQYTNE